VFRRGGHLWRGVQEQNPDKIIRFVKIDVNPKTIGTLKGNNLKYLKTLNIHDFDVIDLDAYGIPFAQCEILFTRRYAGIVHVTVIQSGMGQLPKGMLYVLGYPSKMTSKCPSLFNHDGIQKFLDYLSIRGVSEIEYFWYGRKFYGVFSLTSTTYK
jgi:hypothetical protein